MRWSMPVLATLLAVVLAGCGAGGVSGSPAGSTATPTSSRGPSSSASTPSALPSASADPIHPPTPVPVAGGLMLERVPDQPALAAADMTDVAAGPTGYVAVGCRALTATTSTNCRSAAWHSADGRSWEQATLPTAGMIDGGMFVAGGDSGYVAWGGLMEPPGAGIWASTDGTSWEAAPVISEVAISSVVRHGGAWFASGGAGMRGAVLFTSPDGVTWEEIEFASGTPIWSLDLLVSTGDELLGFGPSGDGELMTSATFRSTDGLRWRATNELPQGANIGEAVVVDGRVVGTGRDDTRDDPSPAGWVWTGGTSWVPSAFPAGPRGGPLAAGAGELVMLGGEGPQMSALWSIDGMEWLPAGSVPDAARDGWEQPTGCTGGPCGNEARTVVRGLTGTAAGFVAVGSTQLAKNDSRAVVWIGTVPRE